MHTILLSSGRRWNATALRWAVQRLRHRGPATRLVRSPRLTLFTFGGPPLASRSGDLRLWSWNVDRAEHERLVEGMAAGPRDEPPALACPQGLILTYEESSGRISIHSGVDRVHPLYFAQRGRSLLVAPEMKAFSCLPDPDRIRRLDPGGSLHFDPGRKRPATKKAWRKWRPVPETTRGYAACQRELEKLLHEGMADVRRSHPGRLAIALSGGLDSAVAARLAVESGATCEAFCVWFDSGRSLPPPDLAGARLTAGALGIPLHELRIGPEQSEPLARECVYLMEECAWRPIETGTYVLRLVKELKRRRFNSVLTGEGADGLFAGRVFPRQLGRGFHRELAAVRRTHYVIETLPPTLGLRVLSPFLHAPLAEFASSLPQDFLVEKTEAGLVGKKILRETLGECFQSPLVCAPKDFPFRSAGAEALFEAQWGSRGEREARYRRWLDAFLALPDFRHAPLAVRLRVGLGLEPGGASPFAPAGTLPR